MPRSSGRLLYPEGHASLEDITLHPRLGHLTLEPRFGAGLDPARVAMLGVRDVDGAERVLLDTQGVGRPEGPEALEGLPVFVHLDLDVLDPLVLPAPFGAPGGWSFEGLYDALVTLAAGAELIGAEVTGAHPAHVAAIFAAITPLL